MLRIYIIHTYIHTHIHTYIHTYIHSGFPASDNKPSTIEMPMKAEPTAEEDDIFNLLAKDER